MDDLSVEISQALVALEATAPRIASSVEGHAPTRLHTRPDEDTWSANDILAHLRSCADVWGKSILTMINEDHPKMRYVSPRTWIRKTDYPSLAFHESFAAFRMQRGELLATLKSLAPEDWLRGATFTGTTRGKEQTVLSYAQRLANHEGVHCTQIEELLV